MKYSCLIVGEQSLLVQCAEHILASGHDIKGVVAANPTIIDWCNQRKISCLPSISDLKTSGFLESTDFDYLLSITNLKILPAALLSSANKKAINFHDGPLPRYAGLNAPVWALLAGEQEHGITWHVMTEETDKGVILEQEHFPIVPDETAFTLNAKCYQAGLEAFIRLSDQLASDSVVERVQDESEFTYFGLNDRPSAAATIDWQQSAQDIVRLVKALNFGGYANPVTSPKLWLDGKILLVGEASCGAQDSNLPTGQITALDEVSISVATVEGVVTLSQMTCLHGQAVDVAKEVGAQGFSVGSTIPCLSTQQKDAVDLHYKSCAKYENYWERALVNFEPVTFPLAGKVDVSGQTKSKRYKKIDLNALESISSSTTLSQTELTAAIALLLGRLAMKESFGFGLSMLEKQMGDFPVGYFLEALPLTVQLDAGQNFSQFAQAFNSLLDQHTTKKTVASDVFARQPLLSGAKFQPAITFSLVDEFSAESAGTRAEATQFVIEVHESAKAIQIISSGINETAIQKLVALVKHFLAEVINNPAAKVTDVSIVTQSDQQLITEWNATQKVSTSAEQPLASLFEEQVNKTPDAVACVFEGAQLSYAELNTRANQLANYLLAQGVQPEDRVGLLLNRSIDMVVAMWATFKAGCCYVPLDPVYPADRIAYMADDAGLRLVLLNREHQSLLAENNCEQHVIESISSQLKEQSETNPGLAINNQALAYVIYTSGSTGKPKGVMVEQRNVVNFFQGMDERLVTEPGTWLAVTSISFDISVLELLWALCRGFKVVLYADERRQKTESVYQSRFPDKAMDFNLFYWNVAEDESEYDEDKYRLLIEGAKFADKNGFNAVWTPERHFAAFGGLFPNPSVTSAALSTITENVQLRAGSCVAPLHSPIRIAEEWSVVDNLSRGRVGIAIASGWAPPDFAIKPENFADAKNVMFETAETVRKLWRGESVNFPGPTGKDVSVRTLPRPVQKELPLWVTTAGNVDSFTKAAEIGANLLTHLLGQTIEEVAEKVKAYREAWKRAGHPGQGTVTLMLHTFAGNDMQSVEEVVRAPMKRYLKSAMFLVKAAAWQFPTFKQMSEEQGKTLDEFFETISDEDMDGLLEFAFQRYFHTSGLFGGINDCLAMVDKVKKADVDEIGCLIDFGIDTETVLSHLPYLAEVLDAVKTVNNQRSSGNDYSIPALFESQAITHFQCTPSMALMLSNDERARPGLAGLQQMMVGGEAFPPALAKDLSSLVGGKLSNMYGPTETTIWSSTSDVCDETIASSVSIGTPLVNQQIHILDERQQPMPVGVPGELVIGGNGVVRGYHNRAELTDERFIPDVFSKGNQAKMYRTGDLARWCDDGTLECLGRIDHQVKIRGYRVELGEIEALLTAHESVREGAVILREDTPGDQRLVAYMNYHADKPATDAEVLKQYLGQNLPEFMVPSIFVELPALPLTPNGKVDRKALPAPEKKSSGSDQAYQAPENDVEKMIAEIWQGALGISQVSSRDNFFDIGGHSLLVVQVLKELRDKTGKVIQMTDLFRYTTIEALAQFLAGDGDNGEAIEAGQARAAQRKASRGRRRRGR